MTPLTNPTTQSSLLIQSNQLMENSIESQTSLNEDHHRILKILRRKMEFKKIAVSQIQQVNSCSPHRRILQKDQNKSKQRPPKKKNSRSSNIHPFHTVQAQTIINSVRQFISARIHQITVIIFFSLVLPSAIVMLHITQFIQRLQLNQPNLQASLIPFKIVTQLILTLGLIPN